MRQAPNRRSPKHSVLSRSHAEALGNVLPPAVLSEGIRKGALHGVEGLNQGLRFCRMTPYKSSEADDGGGSVH